MKQKVMWCKPCIVLMKNEKNDCVSKLYKFTYFAAPGPGGHSCEFETASYTLQTSFEHLNDIILGAISTYGDCRAAAVLNALLGGKCVLRCDGRISL